MRRVILALWVITFFSAAGPVSAETQIYYGFNIGITNAPPPPKIVYQEAPAVVIVPDTKVYVVDRGDHEGDFFRYGDHWYVMMGGFWYRGGSYAGPYKVIDVRSVPEPILFVPAKHWKHHPHGGPPGLAKKTGGDSQKSASKGKKGKGH